MKDAGFDAVAGYYDRLARLVFGRAMVQSQIKFLGKVSAGSRILVLGGGTGWWLSKLLLLCPDCQIVYIDSSTRMLDKARKNARADHRISFQSGTHDSINETHSFDVIITFYFLDLFSEQRLVDLTKKIMISARPGAMWLITDFVSNRLWHEWMLRIMYVFFKFTVGLENQRLPNWVSTLAHQGIQEVEQSFFYRGFIRSAVYQIGRKPN